MIYCLNTLNIHYIFLHRSNAVVLGVKKSLILVSYCFPISQEGDWEPPRQNGSWLYFPLLLQIDLGFLFLHPLRNFLSEFQLGIDFWFDLWRDEDKFIFFLICHVRLSVCKNKPERSERHTGSENRRSRIRMPPDAPLFLYCLFLPLFHWFFFKPSFNTTDFP